MFLKSLSMKGFKSFADPTVLEFEPGITVVVGPNGSGKSNVVDAVTWVLGAQGPRSLRSRTMEDVIFAGTSSRPALGRAEVSLTIDNSSSKLPVDMAEVTITRTLFRTGDSEYAINGTACRLLDIQDLLSDSGVGRQQHMIIGQGQLDAVLNARPEDRRAVIEEAAGVLKHRRRRERAERRLAATQENLERLGDLVRELRRQIRPLERQAAAARSHASVAAELRALRIHLAGTELAALGRRRDGASAALEALAAEERRLHDTVARLDAQAAETTAELSSRREEDLAGALGRVQGLVERARGMANVLRERSRALAAALDAAADVDVVSTLESEASRLVAELAATEEEDAALAPERESLAAAVRELEAEADAAGGAGAAGDDPALALVDGRRRIELAQRALEQDARAVRGADERAEALARRAAAVTDEVARLTEQVAALAAGTGGVRDEAQAKAAAHEAARGAATDAERSAQAAEQDRHRTAARAEALARALHELEGSGGRELLADVDGVIGSLVDLVEIDEGWEAAFEAAAGASMGAVVVSGRDAAREALSRLHRRGTTGALLPAPSGTARSPDGTAGAALPAAAEALRPHVRLRGGAAPEVAALLDVLLHRAVRVEGWEAALDVALDRPELVVVTTEGDRFAAAGWRVRSGRSVVTAAAVEDAEARARAAALAADRALERLQARRVELEQAAAAALEATRANDRHEAARSAAEADRHRAEQERERLARELAAARAERAEVAGKVDAGRDEVGRLESALPALQAAADDAAARAGAAAAAAAALAERRRVLVARRQALEVRVASLAERRRVLTARQAEVERRLSGHAAEREAAAARRLRLEAEGVALGRLEETVVRERRRLETLLGALRTDYSHQVERVRAGAARMETIRRERAAAEQAQDQARERARQLDREAAEATLRADALTQSIETDLAASVVEALDAPLPELPDGVSAAAHAASLATRLAALGPVNPLALDELSALEERHRELDSQMEDVRAARRQLHTVVRALDREIAEQFAAAAADVNEHFSALVANLFPGGTGRLTLTEPEDPLNTGVEIEVRPAGRNIRRVSLLSGGERSMAALAFLFAVFRSRPSPFYLMDEVEAALDDVNLHRFLGLVREFRDEAQLIVVSHQKRTMEAADALYGVTMAPGGSSQVVSQKAVRRQESALP